MIKGIHHITALASDPQQNLEFYTGILGLRLVKKTVNFDAPEVYHFYFGNQTGDPGTILTFFPYERIKKGANGKGMVTTTSFSVPASSLHFWEARMKQYYLQYIISENLFNETVMHFHDPDGLRLEFVFNSHDKRNGFSYGNIPVEHSIKGFYSIEITSDNIDKTSDLLTSVMNYELISEKDNRFRFAADINPSSYIDIVFSPEKLYGINGGGTVHHVAFSVSDREEQEEIRAKLVKAYQNPTHIIDRQYFTSVYLREPGGVLFEIATDGPGFMIDEDEKHLGEQLKLPPQYEINRINIESKLKPVNINIENFA